MSFRESNQRVVWGSHITQNVYFSGVLHYRFDLLESEQSTIPLSNTTVIEILSHNVYGNTNLSPYPRLDSYLYLHFYVSSGCHFLQKKINCVEGHAVKGRFF